METNKKLLNWTSDNEAVKNAIKHLNKIGPCVGRLMPNERQQIIDWTIEQYGNVDLIPNSNGVVTYKFE